MLLRAKLNDYVQIAKGHLDQWMKGEDAAYAPFMFALTSEALIRYVKEVDSEELDQVLPLIKSVADKTWATCWVPGTKSFIYRINEASNGAPDLNGLIVPVYQWLYEKTGQAVYRERADLIFEGAVLGAWLNGSKQFNQTYRWSFDYVISRK